MAFAPRLVLCFFFGTLRGTLLHILFAKHLHEIAAIVEGRLFSFVLCLGVSHHTVVSRALVIAVIVKASKRESWAVRR